MKKKRTFPFFLFLGIIMAVSEGALAFLLPVGIVAILLNALGVFDDLKSSRSSARSVDTMEERRADKYKLMAIGAEALSIEHMANSVGISYESCLREVQKLVISGGFGPGAYINYVDKTLVLGDKARAGATQSKTPTWYASDVGTKVTTRRSSDSLPRDQRPQAQAQPKKTAERAEQKPKEKGAFGAAPALLMALGIFLLAFGLVGLGVSIDEIAAGWGSAAEVLFSTSFLAGGVASLMSSLNMRRRSNRFKAYQVVLTGRDFISIQELAEISGVKEKTVRKDLGVMLERGLLTPSAYVDHGAGLLILKPGSVPEKEAEPEVPEDGEDRYKALLREIRQVNEEIPDPSLSAKIDEMETLTGAIFKAVQEKPEKLPQIKSFMSYYLPTALKLLHSYAKFDQADAKGENVETAKADIERILDMLVDGFRKQLDKLYEADAMDISTDIDVLESMLRRDGLSSDGAGFGQVMM